MAKDKKKELKDNPPKQYLIYGIFDFQEKALIFVDLDYDKTELEFDLEDYDPERYDIVEFQVMLG